ncbi:MAG: ribonuclease P protein component [Candidatus Riflebacteria bacterium]|nr:ribonuclease P protein component [Candidatus Riflebacteria bacterium]
MKVRTLKTRTEIEDLTSHGRRVALEFQVVYFQQIAGQSDSAVAIQVSKRLGKAVYRNRIRRVIKEICRLDFPRFRRNGHFVIIARSKAREADFNKLRSDLNRLFETEGFLASEERSTAAHP